MSESRSREFFAVLATHYCGFYIDSRQGNNAFSYENRRCRRIFVPPLRRGKIDDLRQGDNIVFSEIVDGREQNHTGLQDFYYLTPGDKHIFIFDNHNHAFFFWLLARQFQIMPGGLPLLHVDQHTDMRHPSHTPPPVSAPAAEIWAYTNFALNVGNFIRPALDLGVFSEMCFVGGSTDFTRAPPKQFVLDLDMDIFSEEMAYIPEEQKIAAVRDYMRQADFITVATSPFFMPQDRAIQLIRELFAPYSGESDATQ